MDLWINWIICKIDFVLSLNLLFKFFKILDELEDYNSCLGILVLIFNFGNLLCYYCKFLNNIKISEFSLRYLELFLFFFVISFMVVLFFKILKFMYLYIN